MFGLPDSKLFLQAKAKPRLLNNPRTITLGKFNRTIRTARIDDNNLFGKGRALQARLDLMRSIQGNQYDREGFT